MRSHRGAAYVPLHGLTLRGGRGGQGGELRASAVWRASGPGGVAELLGLVKGVDGVIEGGAEVSTECEDETDTGAEAGAGEGAVAELLGLGGEMGEYGGTPGRGAENGSWAEAGSEGEGWSEDDWAHGRLVELGCLLGNDYTSHFGPADWAEVRPFNLGERHPRAP